MILDYTKLLNEGNFIENAEFYSDTEPEYKTTDREILKNNPQT